MIVLCCHCKKEFDKPACHIKRVKNVFCSVACHDKFQTVRSSKICIICGDLFSRRNIHRYTTCDNSDCRSKYKRGEHNGNWKGGVTSIRKRDMSTSQYKNWRKSVFERDNYTCICGKRGGDLAAHHIKPWAYFEDLRYDLLNHGLLILHKVVLF